MRAKEREALASYMTAIADAVMQKGFTDSERNFLVGYTSAHLAGLAGLLKVTDSGKDLSGSIDRDREMYSDYVKALLNKGLGRATLRDE